MSRSHRLFLGTIPVLSWSFPVVKLSRCSSAREWPAAWGNGTSGANSGGWGDRPFRYGPNAFYKLLVRDVDTVYNRSIPRASMRWVCGNYMRPVHKSRGNESHAMSEKTATYMIGDHSALPPPGHMLLSGEDGGSGSHWWSLKAGSAVGERRKSSARTSEPRRAKRGIPRLVSYCRPRGETNRCHR